MKGEHFTIHLLLAWQSGAKGSDVSAADWRYQGHVQNYRNFTLIQLWLFSGLEIFVKYRSLYNNTFNPTI